MIFADFLNELFVFILYCFFSKMISPNDCVQIDAPRFGMLKYFPKILIGISIVVIVWLIIHETNIKNLNVCKYFIDFFFISNIF